MASLEERFWSKVDRRGDDECWNWTGTKARSGGGKYYGSIGGEKAHRFSFTLHANGAALIPGTEVCHSCDNPLCVNPNHLFLGTRKSNAEDMAAKGRVARHQRRFTVEQVRAIHRSLLAGVNQYMIADLLGTTPGVIGHIKKGRSHRAIWEEFHGAVAA